mmetsp:Transcript_108618/g.292076  ORF Transcript_108618/g.292076 Transcript_108618/m.292076 type:complete len:93 (-) Transcript_108618:70-348(-)
MLGLCLGNARLASSSGLGYDVGWPELGPRVWSMPLLSLTSHDLWDGDEPRLAHRRGIVVFETAWRCCWSKKVCALGHAAGRRAALEFAGGIW